MNMNKNDTFDRTLQEDRQTSLRSFSWGNRELRISSEKISLYVNGISYDTAPMLDIIHKAGVNPQKISPARWISLIRGQPTGLPGCEKPFILVRTPSGYTAKCLETASKKDRSFQAEI